GAENNNDIEQNYLKNQQDELFEIVRQKKARQSARLEFRDESKAPSIPKFYLNGKSLGWVEITPDLKHIIFRLDQFSSYENTHVENHVTADGYSKSTPARPKVGRENAKHELVVMNLETSEFNTVDKVAYGFNIDNGLVARHCLITLAYFFVISVIGYFILKTRELAA
ncbi:MAG: hypothetical protein GY888_32050, partial [Planctomycetaceae bacterium]|nr:hypothetical protein [Planctomycetaceae bacterium]